MLNIFYYDKAIINKLRLNHLYHKMEPSISTLNIISAVSIVIDQIDNMFVLLQSFQMRKHYFNDEETGFFKTQNREPAMQNPMAGKCFPITFRISLYCINLFLQVKFYRA